MKHTTIGGMDPSTSEAAPAPLSAAEAVDIMLSVPFSQMQ